MATARTRPLTGSWNELIGSGPGEFRQAHNNAYTGLRKFRGYVLRFAITCAVVGSAVLLATDDIDYSDQSKSDQVLAPHYHISAHTLIGYILGFFLVLNILPYLNPAKIFRSELKPPGKIEGVVLRVSGTVVLVLLPFYLIYWFALEDISGFASKRGPEFIAASIFRPFAS